MGQVIVVGSFNVDHVWQCDALPQPGATLIGQYISGPGGKGFNQAMAACRSGAATTFVCALGSDAGGQLARMLVAADGIDLRDHASDAPTGTAGIFVDTAGRNSIVIGDGANAALSAAAVRHLCTPQADDVLLAQLETPVSSVIAALQLARTAGCTTLMNPAPANAATTPELLRLADILTPNETELAALLRRHAAIELAAEAVAATTDAQLHDWCRQLQPKATVVITLGAAGCFVSHPDAQHAWRGDDRAHYRMAAPPAKVVDTTGAGDAFSGALACALLQAARRPFRSLVAAASAYASRSTETAGAALSMPRERLAFAS